MTTFIMFVVGLVAGVVAGYTGRDKITSVLNKDGPGEERKIQTKDGPGEERK
jgi:hypothetical protein